MSWFSGTFPFAVAIVDSENDENWSWFFNNLSIVLTAQGRTITLVSGCNKGLAESVSKVFPASHHASCLRYLKQKLFSIYSSMYGKSFGNHVVDLFLKCANAPRNIGHISILRAIDMVKCVVNFLDHLVLGFSSCALCLSVKWLMAS